MASELNQQDYSDSRLGDMEDVLDCVDMKGGIKTRDLMKNAMREDVGNEITKLNVDKLIFRRDAQEVNIKRAEAILNEFHICYEVTFGKKFMPQSKTAAKDVTKQMKEYNVARLKEALGQK
jgi:hypothetical protein